MGLEDSNKERRRVEEIMHQNLEENVVMDRHQFMQESRTDFEREPSHRSEDVHSDVDEYDDVKSERLQGFKCRKRKEVDPQEGPSGLGQNSNRSENISELERDPYDISDGQLVNDLVENNVARLERYGNYLELYGPQLERYGNQLERFGSQLERIGPQLERCGNNLERYGPQLEAIGRSLVRTESQLDGIPAGERPLCAQQNNMNFHTQTESGNEGFAPQGADSCQGSTTSCMLTNHGRQGHWISSNNRRLSRRPPFQVNDGLIRHWIRRRNVDPRDVVQFNRFRDERRRALWRNDGDIREFRRIRAAWRHQDNFFHRHQHRDGMRDSNDVEENLQSSVGASLSGDRYDNGGLIQQDHVRIPRNETLQLEDPNYGYVLVDDHSSPGPSRQDTSSHPVRRPRSNMSLRPLNIFTPPLLGPVTEYNAESDEENDQRPDIVGRRATRARETSVIRSWFMMNNYFQPRPLFIGQGDSKAMDGPFAMQRTTNEDQIFNTNDRNIIDLGRIPRPIARNMRLERRQQRQQLAFQALA